MTDPARSWDDLRVRAITGVTLTLVAILVVWVGGLTIVAASAVVAAVIVWEVARMCAPDQRSAWLQIAGLTGVAVFGAPVLPPIFLFPVLAAPVAVGASLLRQRKVTFAVYAFAVILACYGLAWGREVYGMVWLFWLAITVAFTDIAGYFGGKSIGGPKFWPAVSPKKTWAGIISGWVSALVVVAGFALFFEVSWLLIPVAVLVSFASQLGDIAESALKRRTGVKDSSSLLPGHGGVYDRFDGLLGGALFLLISGLLLGVPLVVF